MSGLSHQNLKILKHYAEAENRLLYWNYLAQLPGNDGYGLLALGVVRNDNMPGAVANTYAQTHGGRQLTEREWEAFGRQLIKEDLKRREEYFDKGDAAKALNLPVHDVQKAHDITFDDHRLDPNAWTPRRLLEAARNQAGEQAAERIWSNMLDNSALGLERGGQTINDIRRYMPMSDGARYLVNLGKASVVAANVRDTVDPDTIGASNFYHHYDTRSRQWSLIAESGQGVPLIHRETDPKRLQELNDTRQLRLELQQKAAEFHPQDPYRTIARSPRTLAENRMPDDELSAPVQQAQSAQPALPAGSAPPLRVGNDVRDPEHPGHAAYAQALSAVKRMEFEQKIPHGEHTEILAARLAAEAAEHKQGITRVEMSRDGQIRVIERHYAFDEGKQFGIATSDATSQSIQQSSSRWLQATSPHYSVEQSVASRSEAQSLALARLNPADLAMFSTIRGRTPAHIGDDTVAHAMLEAKRNGIDDASRIENVVLHGQKLHVLGTTPGFRVAVDVTANTPELAQLVEVNDALNRERQQQIAQNQQQEQVRAQSQGRSISSMG